MNPVLLTLVWQSLVTLLGAVVGYALGGSVAAYSALAGGAATVLPNGFLAARLLAPSLRYDAARMLRSAWLGEVGKIVLTVVMFAAIFVAVKPLSAVALFGTFIAAQLVTLVVVLVDARAAETSVRG